MLLKFQNHSQYDSKNFTFVGYIYSIARNVCFLKSFLNDIWKKASDILEISEDSAFWKARAGLYFYYN